jgi:hypothetical protein
LPQLFLFETGGIRKHDLGKNNQKFVLANHYNYVMLVPIPAGLTAPKAFGVAEVEKPQSGGADCGYTFIRRTDAV